MHDRPLSVLVALLAAMTGRIKVGVSHAKRRLELAFFAGDCAELWARRRFGTATANSRTVRAAQGLSSALLSFVVVGIVILLGILIYSEVQQAIPSPSNTDLSNASSNATSTFSDSMELAPLVILVGVAALILAVVQRFR